MSHRVFRNGRVHVLARMCDTCIFRPGNLMQLREGRVEEMVSETQRLSGSIPCHETTHSRKTKTAVCRGFFDRHPTGPLQVAQRLGFVVFDPVPRQKEPDTKG